MRVSIITVCLNSAATIEETLQSVVGQSYPDIEYIIVDGVSTDETLNIVDRYRSRIAKIISEKDAGIFYAMNKGIQAATGDIVGILNSDDVFADKDVIGKVATAMNESHSDVCWGDLLYVKQNDPGKITRVWQSSAYEPGAYQRGWQPAHPAFFVRRSVYEKYGLFRPELRISSDYELMFRLLEKFKVSSVYIPSTLAKMREGGNSNWKNLSRVWAGNREVAESWRLNGIRMPWYMIPLKLSKKFWQTVRRPKN